jgi:photosystem II stability/assembly factor-like uncharacterized protein
MGQSARLTDKPAARRRICKLFVLTLILLSLALALPAGASAAAGWFKQSSGTTTELDAVAFGDASHGWAIGNADGTAFILATTNGGLSWTQDSESNVTLNSVASSDANHAWAVGSTPNSWGGDDLAIFATIDGGANWSAQASGPTGEFNAVTFLPDGVHGWAVGKGGAIAATTDGGANWQLQTSGSGEDLYAVSFSDASHGCAVGNFGTILATTNGGLTWSPQSSGSGGAHLMGVDFVDANRGWAVGYYYGVFPLGIAEASVILATTDGGATWIPQSWGSGAWLYDVAFSDASHGWVVGNDQGGDGGGPILVTSNGGATWTRQAVAPTSLYGLASSDATHAWAVGRDGTILATTDGGGTPTPTPTPKVTLKLSGLKSGVMKLGKSVTAKGTVTPTSLAGSKVTLTAQLKKGAKWVKAKSMARTISASGAYSWKYKPAKRGAYRMRAAIAKTAAHAAATTKWRTFRVK